MEELHELKVVSIEDAHRRARAEFIEAMEEFRNRRPGPMTFPTITSTNWAKTFLFFCQRSIDEEGTGAVFAALAEAEAEAGGAE